MMHRILAITLGLAAMSAPAVAQTRSVAGCWLRPAPAPTCSGYIVTEASAEFSLRPRENMSNPRFMLGVGFMRNMDTASSVGGVVAWDVGRGWSLPARADLRYRRWLSGAAFDLGVGAVQRAHVSPDGSVIDGRVFGPTAMVGAEWRYIALDLRGESIRANGQTFNDAYLGARTTSIGAPIAVLAGLALIVAVVSQVSY
jgi:hypothetical protein